VTRRWWRRPLPLLATRAVRLAAYHTAFYRCLPSTPFYHGATAPRANHHIILTFSVRALWNVDGKR